MSDIRIVPSSYLPHRFEIPSSKSHTMRALIFSLMAKGKSIIKNPLMSPDTFSMLSIIKSFGAKVALYSDSIEIIGVGGKLKVPDDVLHVGNSGIILRFMGALSALLDSNVIFTGDASIRHRRVVLPLLSGLKQMGAVAESMQQNGLAPILIKGPIVATKNVEIDGEDSQPVSALLIASSFVKGKTHFSIRNPGEKPWVEMTLSWMKSLGIRLESDGFSSYTSFGSASLEGFYRKIGGDFSSAAYPAAAALILKREVFLDNLFLDDVQGDKKFFTLLQEMGAVIEMHPSFVYIDGRKSEIRGKKMDINDCIDALPILAVLGCFAEGELEVTGAKMARNKESDRISSIGRELRKMGAFFEEKEDGFVVKQSKLFGSELFSHEDHRLALSLSLAALGASGESILKNVDCVQKSYLSFFSEMGFI
ncbi:MAG: 3-phosphoshikimate 1-carboxyvinyltransferase [Chlamydiota bacterium]